MAKGKAQAMNNPRPGGGRATNPAMDDDNDEGTEKDSFN